VTMDDTLRGWIDPIATAIELAGVAIIAAGAILAAGLFLFGGASGRGWRTAYENFRSNLGRAILLGLEFLVGADIIATVTAPLSFDRVAVLAIVVLIRTFLSFSLETEITGTLPWRRSGNQPDEGSDRRQAKS
jgi:uncharacterized membrane protein